MINFLKKYEVLVLLGGILGIVFGIFFQDLVPYFSFIGKLFISSLKVILIPFISVSIFLAFIKFSSLNQFKSLSLTSFLYYGLTSSAACIVGLLSANNILQDHASSVLSYNKFDAASFQRITFHDFVVNLIPTNLFESFTSSNVLQVVIISSILGLCSLRLNSKSRNVLTDIFESTNNLMMIYLSFVLKFAPLGIMSLIADTLISIDNINYSQLINLFLAIAISAFIHSIFTLPLICFYIGKYSPLKLFKHTQEALLVAISSASSSASLPATIKCLESQADVSKGTTRFITPLGATLNMDGSALYQSIVVIFLAKFSGMDPSFSQQLIIFIFIMLSSAGTAGIPGGGVVMVGMALEFLGLPLELIGIYLLIDRFWDYPITAINVWGDIVGAKTVDNILIKSGSKLETDKSN